VQDWKIGFVGNRPQRLNGRLLQFALKLEVLDSVIISVKTLLVILKEALMMIIYIYPCIDSNLAA